MGGRAGMSLGSYPPGVRFVEETGQERKLFITCKQKEATFKAKSRLAGAVLSPAPLSSIRRHLNAGVGFHRGDRCTSEK